MNAPDIFQICVDAAAAEGCDFVLIVGHALPKGVTLISRI